MSTKADRDAAAVFLMSLTGLTGWESLNRAAEVFARIAALESELLRLRALSAARFADGNGPVPASLAAILGTVQVTPEGILLAGDAWARLKAAWERMERRGNREGR